MNKSTNTGKQPHKSISTAQPHQTNHRTKTNWFDPYNINHHLNNYRNQNSQSYYKTRARIQQLQQQQCFGESDICDINHIEGLTGARTNASV